MTARAARQQIIARQRLARLVAMLTAVDIGFAPIREVVEEGAL
jgi:hypothetical protein